tara:strand:- start:5907 stop:6215 length:309 start_codon:yes stop_codon:yes gene_type:complete
MAITAVSAKDKIKSVATLALSTSFLGAGNYITVARASKVDLWSDDPAIALTYKFSYDGGTTFTPEMALAAGSVYTAEPPKGALLTVDAKSASGTPNLGVLAF